MSGYNKANNKSLGAVVEVNPFGEEVAILANETDLATTTLRAFGLTSMQDLGVFATLNHRVRKLRVFENNKSLGVFDVNSPYFAVYDIFTMELKYSVPAQDGKVWDACIFENFLIIVGSFTGKFKVYDLHSMVEVQGFPTFDGNIYAVDVSLKGEICFFGDFTDMLKVVNIYDKQQIAGFPTYSDTVGLFSTTPEPIVAIHNIIKCSILFYRTNDGGNFTAKTINLLDKTGTDIDNAIPNAGRALHSFDGERIYYGETSSSSSQIASYNVNINTFSTWNLGASTNYSQVIFSNKLRTKRYRITYADSLLREYDYDGTTQLNTYSTGLTSNVTKRPFVVTDLLKGT